MLQLKLKKFISVSCQIILFLIKVIEVYGKSPQFTETESVCLGGGKPCNLLLLYTTLHCILSLLCAAFTANRACIVGDPSSAAMGFQFQTTHEHCGSVRTPAGSLGSGKDGPFPPNPGTSELPL